ncbi:MAG: phosphoenolpyruvate--protein phosphotransferase [Candidatus Tectomicrobia bacterium]|uniref:Phosphoenolpyruvate-protein phosphotransferase n=1 Tax=Tectimicrobiota bacterium TaxID=2528274 RepID=A0A932I4C0_UNCTE|nr:phosphoenolpyruvate--protein phosphotransferase [Candidatus Tectomicrobia bacterium]
MERIEGVGASGGIVTGRAWVASTLASPGALRPVPAAGAEEEIARLARAIEAASAEIEAIRQAASDRLGPSHLYILDLGRLLLRDEMLIGEARRRIQEERLNAEWAIQGAVDHFAKFFESMEDPYFRDRRLDIGHAGERILRHLDESAAGAGREPAEPAILVAHDLTPADVAALSGGKILGFVTDLGGYTSHTAIMAQALGIPAVVGAGDATRRISTGDRLLVDGRAGAVLLNPAEEEAAVYESRLSSAQEALQEALEEQKVYLPRPAATRDGVRVTILANIANNQELDILPLAGTDGVGLYRSEWLYFNRRDLPSEEEQYHCYLRVARVAQPNTAIIRTMDLGGDRGFPLGFPPDKRGETEKNPALGVRGIRFSLEYPALFKRQLRAILRASSEGDLAFMYPMISSMEEVREVQAVLEEVKAGLREEGKPFNEAIRQGILIETPAAALCADHLARHADFLAVGTNDLTQYTLAVDRANKGVAERYEPLHPAVIRLLHGVAQAARERDIPAAVCGELAGDPKSALYLVGLGFRSLSMALSKVPAVRRAIGRSTLAQAEELAAAMRECGSAQEVRAVMSGKRRGSGRGNPAVRPAV